MKKPSLEEAFAELLGNLEQASATYRDNEWHGQYAALFAVIRFLWDTDKRHLGVPLEHLRHKIEPRRGKQMTTSQIHAAAWCTFTVEALYASGKYRTLKEARYIVQDATGGKVTAGQLAELRRNWTKPCYAELRKRYANLCREDNDDAAAGESIEEKAERTLSFLRLAFQEPASPLRFAYTV
jgi:hypothetical protein